MAVARLSAIAGFIGTSNVEAARRFALEPSGTMAHSYVEAFETEKQAFRAFAEDLPERTTFLVDTYDTLRGVATAIEVIEELGLARRPGARLGIRLDSGDLASLARQSRRLLDAAGLEEVRILVSGSLDEHDLDRLRRDGAAIDAAGVGTRMGVSADAPYLDSAYKLVAYRERPVLKLSPGKVTLPGAKQVWREGTPERDTLCLRDEPGVAGAEPLLVSVMRDGRRVGPVDTIAAARRRLEADLDGLGASARDIDAPVAPVLTVSERLAALAAELTARLETAGR